MKKIVKYRPIIKTQQIKYLSSEPVELEIPDCVKESYDELGDVYYDYDVIAPYLPDDWEAARTEYEAAQAPIHEARDAYIASWLPDGETQSAQDREDASNHWYELHDALKLPHELIQLMGAECYTALIQRIDKYAADKRQDGYYLKQRQCDEGERLGAAPRYTEMSVVEFVNKYRPTIEGGKIKIALWRTQNTLALQDYVNRHRVEIMAVLEEANNG